MAAWVKTTRLPTIFTMPTYPDPVGGFMAEWRSSERHSTRFSLFDGVGATGVPTGSRLPTTLLDNFKDLFVIAETDWGWGNQSAGTLGESCRWAMESQRQI